MKDTRKIKMLKHLPLHVRISERSFWSQLMGEARETKQDKGREKHKTHRKGVHPDYTKRKKKYY